MKRRFKISLVAVVVLALSLPAGFAIAQVLNQTESDGPPLTHTDPDPSTDAIEIGDAYTKAAKSGDPEAIEIASAAVWDELLSRLGPEEKAAVESASPEPDVPAGTYAYINNAINDGRVNQCRGLLGEGRQDDLCELIVLYGEGQIEAGPYTKEEVEAILSEKEQTR